MPRWVFKAQQKVVVNPRPVLSRYSLRPQKLRSFPTGKVQSLFIRMQSSELQLRSACSGQYDNLEVLEERDNTLRLHRETTCRLLFHIRDKRD